MSRARDTADQINRINSSAADATAITVDSSENVGIGTSSPEVNSKIHVKGASSANLLIEAPTDNASLTLQCGSSDAGAEGAFVQFTQNTTAKWQMGMNTDNSFRWYNYNTSSEAMRIDSSGRVTMPYQPAFDAYRGSGSYASGSTVTSMDLNSTRLNVGSHYDTASNKLRFTAPVAGVYQFNFRTIISGSYNSGHVKMVKNGVDLQGTDTHFSPNVASQWSQVNVQIIVALNANDYMQVRFQNNTNIYGNSYQSFNGHLLG